MNLITNASEALSGQPGTIRVTTERVRYVQETPPTLLAIRQPATISA